MTKRNFIAQTGKTVEEVVEHELVQSKIDETLINMKLGPDSLLAMALHEVAERAAAVTRAKILNREPHLLRAGYERDPEKPWEEWDPVVVFVNKPDHTIENCKTAIAALLILGERYEDRDYHEIDYAIAVQQQFIDTIKEQI